MRLKKQSTGINLVKGLTSLAGTLLFLSCNSNSNSDDNHFGPSPEELIPIENVTKVTASIDNGEVKVLIDYQETAVNTQTSFSCQMTNINLKSKIVDAIRVSPDQLECTFENIYSNPDFKGANDIVISYNLSKNTQIKVSVYIGSDSTAQNSPTGYYTENKDSHLPTYNLQDTANNNIQPAIVMIPYANGGYAAYSAPIQLFENNPPHNNQLNSEEAQTYCQTFGWNLPYIGDVLDPLDKRTNGTFMELDAYDKNNAIQLAFIGNNNGWNDNWNTFYTNTYSSNLKGFYDTWKPIDKRFGEDSLRYGQFICVHIGEPIFIAAP